jgi:hypothetical protein
MSMNDSVSRVEQVRDDRPAVGGDQLQQVGFGLTGGEITSGSAAESAKKARNPSRKAA